MPTTILDEELAEIFEAGIETDVLADFSRELSVMMGGSRQPGTETLLEWGGHYLSHYYTDAPNELHKVFSRDLTKFHLKRGQRYSAVAPRGFAKSSWCTLAYPLKCICEGLEKYIIIVSDTFDQAKEFLESIKSELEENQKLAADFPYATGRGKVWTKNKIITANGIAVEVISRGMKIRGRRRREARPTLILVDDMENDDDAFSPRQREKTTSWFNKALMKAGDPSTNVIVVGTIIHRDAVLPKLQRTPGWTNRFFKAVEQWPERMDLWEKWEKVFSDLNNENAEKAAREYFERRKKEMTRGAKVLWPERVPLYDLMVMRVMEGVPSFESEMQNNPRDPSLVEWPESYFGDHIWAPRWPKDDELTIKTMALDPSKGRDAKHGDYQAIIRLGRHLSGMIYVEADMIRVPKEELVAQSLDILQGFRRCEAFAIETNQMQELLADDFRRQAALRNLIVPEYLINNLVPKPVRIRRIGPYLSRHMLKFVGRGEGTKLLVEQLMDFPNGTFDDGPDALEMALRVAIELSYEMASTL